MQEECDRAGPSYLRRVLQHDGGGEVNVGHSRFRLGPARQQREKGRTSNSGSDVRPYAGRTGARQGQETFHPMGSKSRNKHSRHASRIPFCQRKKMEEESIFCWPRHRQISASQQDTAMRYSESTSLQDSEIALLRATMARRHICPCPVLALCARLCGEPHAPRQTETYHGNCQAVLMLRPVPLNV